MATKKTTAKPAPPTPEEPAKADSAEQTTDYTRAGGHVLTERGWVVEETGQPVGYPAPVSDE